MSDWKVGDKAYVPVAFFRHMGDGVVSVKLNNNNVVFVDEANLLRPIPPSPAPVDVSAIKVGDEVTVRMRVGSIDSSKIPFRVESESGGYVWLSAKEIISHIPSRPPSTLAEFDAMTATQRERWFAEMTKGKVG